MTEITLCSCIDARGCCICGVPLRGGALAYLANEGGTLHVYCTTCGVTDEEPDADLAGRASYWQENPDYEAGVD